MIEPDGPHVRNLDAVKRQGAMVSPDGAQVDPGGLAGNGRVCLNNIS